MNWAYNKRQWKLNKRAIRILTTEILSDHALPNDVAGRAYVMSAVLNCHDDETLAGLGLEPTELRVVAERYRRMELWTDEGVEPFHGGLELVLYTDIGRGIVMRTRDTTNDEWLYGLTSMAAAKEFCARYGLSEVPEELSKMVSSSVSEVQQD